MAFFLDDTHFSTQFFRSALEGNHLAHGYVLKGRDCDRMYNTALEVAKVLNCQNRLGLAEACQTCNSCRWVAQNAHPAVVTISRLTYLVGDNGSELGPDDLEKLSKKPSQTLIKTEQIGRLIRQLGVSSPDYRVVVFTDATVLPSNQLSGIIPPYDWVSLSANEGKSFHLQPLHRGLFNAESANRFLKTLEEPPAKTIFFFLTDTEQNLFETIVSRCQTVPFHGTSLTQRQPLSDVGIQLCMDWQDAFYAPYIHDIYPAMAEFQRVLVEHEGLDMEQAIVGLQAFFRQHYLEHAEEMAFHRYQQIQAALEQAQSLLRSKTNADQVLQQLFWQLGVRHEPIAPFIKAG